MEEQFELLANWTIERTTVEHKGTKVQLPELVVSGGTKNMQLQVSIAGIFHGTEWREQSPGHANAVKYWWDAIIYFTPFFFSALQFFLSVWIAVLFFGAPTKRPTTKRPTTERPNTKGPSSKTTQP